MARTKQTARKSILGKAPRKHLAYKVLILLIANYNDTIQNEDSTGGANCYVFITLFSTCVSITGCS